MGKYFETIPEKTLKWCLQQKMYFHLNTTELVRLAVITDFILTRRQVLGRLRALER